MVRRKTEVRTVPSWGLMSLMAATLLICGVILMQLMSTNKLTVAGCTSGALKTPAVYLVHIGDEDKPIVPIVIAASRPSDLELGCLEHSQWSPAEVFLVKDEELAQVNKLLKGAMHGGEGRAKKREFRYFLVSKPGTVESGIFDLTQSEEILAALATYFERRQPELHEHLITVTWGWS
ncbi:MAG TPA: hypothetical protein VKA02_01410 [Candidatus Acidoferrum sp.]|nr:hypothetical protein [Candidatus Acidoferrum sp.]